MNNDDPVQKLIDWLKSRGNQVTAIAEEAMQELRRSQEAVHAEELKDCAGKQSIIEVYTYSDIGIMKLSQQEIR
jgi:hypothetical protein